jgi:ribosomal protein L7/L12
LTNSFISILRSAESLSNIDLYEKKIKSAIGDEAKISKLKKSDFGQIVELLKNDNVLFAVKALKDKTGLSLKRSKDIIDSLNIK